MTVEHSVLDVRVSGSWNGDIRSPRAAWCSADAWLNDRWVGTLGDRIVQLDLIDFPNHDRIVHVTGGTSGGATMDPHGGSVPDESTVAAMLTDATSTEVHGLGGTIVVAADGHSGTIDLHDTAVHLTGSWRC